MWKLWSILLFTVCVAALETYGLAGPEPEQPIDSGYARKVEIDKIFIVGNKITRDKIILREVNFKEGDVINFQELEKSLDRIENNIFNTKLFNTVDINIVELSKTRVDILIRVSERWYFFPIPIFKLVDRNFNDWWVNQNHDLSRIEYGVNLYHYNMRGRMERLWFLIQFGYTKRFGLQYRIPYFDKTQQHGIELLLDYKEHTNIAYGTEDHKQQFVDLDQIVRQSYTGGIIYTYRKNYFNYHKSFLTYHNLKANDTLLALNPNYFISGESQQQFIQLNYNYTRDYRDIVVYPLSGYKFQVRLSKYGLGIFKDIDQLDIQAAYVKYLDLNKGFYASNFTSGYLSFPKKQGYANLYGLGYGTNFIRGYELNVIEGQSFLINKTTFKKRIIQGEKKIKNMPFEQFSHFPFALYVKTFFDVGYVDNFDDYENNSRLTNSPVYGFGMGVDIHTFYDLVTRLNYSFNDQGEHGIYLHFKKDF